MSDNKYIVTDDMRKRYPDISIDISGLTAAGAHPLYIETLTNAFPAMLKTIKDMAIIETELLMEKTKLGSMFNDILGMEDANNIIRFETFKLAVDRNKIKVFKMFNDRWDQAVGAVNTQDNNLSV